MKNERLNGGSDGETLVVDGTLLKRYNGNDESLRLPGFIFGVGNKAFAGNESLKNVSLSSNVIAVGEYAFDGCSSLEEIDLPYELRAIGKLAFNGCVKLKSIRFNGTKERWFSVKREKIGLKVLLISLSVVKTAILPNRKKSNSNPSRQLISILKSKKVV